MEGELAVRNSGRSEVWGRTTPHSVAWRDSELRGEQVTRVPGF